MLSRPEDLLNELLHLETFSRKRSETKSSTERKSIDQQSVVLPLLQKEFKDCLERTEFQQIGLTEKDAALKLIPENVTVFLELFREFQKINPYRSALCLTLAAQISPLNHEQQLRIYTGLYELHLWGIDQHLKEDSRRAELYRFLILAERKEASVILTETKEDMILRLDDAQVTSLLYYCKSQYSRLSTQEKECIGEELHQQKTAIQEAISRVSKIMIFLCKQHIERLIKKVSLASSSKIKMLENFVAANEILKTCEQIGIPEEIDAIKKLKEKIARQGILVLFNLSDGDKELWTTPKWFEACTACVKNFGNQQNFDPGDFELEVCLIYYKNTNKSIYHAYLLAKCANSFKKTTFENRDPKFSKEELEKFRRPRERLAQELKLAEGKEGPWINKAGRVWEALAHDPINPDHYLILADLYSKKADKQTAKMLYKWLADGLIEASFEKRGKAELALAQSDCHRKSLEGLSAGIWPDQYAVQAMINPDRSVRHQALAHLTHCYTLHGIDNIYPQAKNLEKILSEWNKFDALMAEVIPDHGRMHACLQELRVLYSAACPALQKPVFIEMIEREIESHKIAWMTGIVKGIAESVVKTPIEVELKETSAKEPLMQERKSIEFQAGAASPRLFESKSPKDDSLKKSTLALLESIEKGAKDIVSKVSGHMEKLPHVDLTSLPSLTSFTSLGSLKVSVKSFASSVKSSLKTRPVDSKTKEIAQALKECMRELRSELEKANSQKLREIQNKLLILLRHILHLANDTSSKEKNSYNRIGSEIEKHLLGGASKGVCFTAGFVSERFLTIFPSIEYHYKMPANKKIFNADLFRILNTELDGVVETSAILNQVLQRIEHFMSPEFQLGSVARSAATV